MSSVRRDRTTLSCARCYRMKKKCDKNTPSCSRCTLAGAQCLAMDRVDKRDIPRSAVQYLEGCLAQAADGALSLTSQSPNASNISSFQVQSFLCQVAVSSLVSLTTSPVIQNNSDIHYHARLFYSSERPPLKIPIHGIYLEEPPRMASQGGKFRSQQLAARAIPSRVATRLFENYCKNVLPIYPCFSESDLYNQLQSFYAADNVLDSEYMKNSCFIVSMILAISSLNTRSTDHRRVASLTEALQRDALKHATSLVSTTLRSLQCLTLLIQMALWVPYTANLWYLSGEMMRMAIALGLHQENGSASALDSQEQKFRQELFWTVYRLERTVAIASGCPLALSDEHITTSLPHSTPSYLPDRSLSQQKAMHRFSSQVRLSQLQSEIHGIQFFDQALPDDVSNYADWVQNVERSIQDWQNVLAVGDAMPEWALRAADRCRLLLYRPCSRMMMPADTSLQTACIVAIRTITSYWSIVQRGGLVFSFTDVFDTFQSSMILIYVVGTGNTLVPGSPLEQQALQALEYLEPLFTGLCTRWPAVVDTAYYVGELKNAVLRDLATNDRSDRLATDERLLAELDFMVTQRRIHSVYHRNVDTSLLAKEVLPGPSPENFTSFGDDLWQNFFDESFPLLNDDLIMSNDMVGLELPLLWTTDAEREPNGGIVSAKPDSVDVDVLLRSVPSCGYCRTRHLKCDQGFPLCGTCTRASRPCDYYDPVLQIDVQRSYVFSLYERYQAQLAKSISLPTAPNSEDSWYRILLTTSPPEQGPGSEPLLNIASFWGPGSSFGYLQRASLLRNDVPILASWQHHSALPAMTPFPTKCSIPEKPVAAALFHVFMNSANTFYATLHHHQLIDLLQAAYEQDQPLSSIDQDVFYLILAISSALTPTPICLPYQPHTYFLEAISNPQRSRADWLSINTLRLLQRQLLICIFLLLSPASGDIWRNLGFAVRLYFDLSHRPSEHDDMDESLLSMLFRTLYCLESQVSIAFGRPSLLIIGDKLREDMTRSTSETLEEQINIRFYWISVLKMQVHSQMLAKTMNTFSMSSSGTVPSSVKADIESWHMNFETDVLPNITTNSSFEVNLAEVLQVWANLQYCQAIFLASQVHPTGIHDAQKYSDGLFEACTFLARYQHKSPLLRLATNPGDQTIVPVFPLNWTIAHSIFSAGLDLFIRCKANSADTIALTKTATSSVLALSLLAGDRAMLSTGFSEIMEDFWATLER